MERGCGERSEPTRSSVCVGERSEPRTGPVLGETAPTLGRGALHTAPYSSAWAPG